MPWLPGDKYLWDFWFAWRETELHLFYLQASRLDCHYNPDLRHNKSSVGHARLTSLGWKEIDGAPAFEKGEAGAWDDLSIWTGSIIEAEGGAYYMFYTARSSEDAPVWTPHEWQRPQNIGLAVSDDLRSWRRTEISKASPVIANPGTASIYDGVSWRDPYVVRGEEGDFFAFICARLKPKEEASIDAGGAVVYLKSRDLEKWDSRAAQPLVHSDEFYQMEVPQVFWRKTAEGKRLYLLFCAQEKDCSRARRVRMPEAECRTGTYYMMSRLLPLDYGEMPSLEEPARLLAPALYAGKLLNPDTEDEPVFFGFPWSDAGGHFTGGLSDPIRTSFNQDGSLDLVEEV